MTETRAARWADQKVPAMAIVSRGDQVHRKTNAWFTVRSQSTPGLVYDVRRVNGKWHCSCLHFSASQQECMHIAAVTILEGFRAKLLQDGRQEAPCANCGSHAVVKNGTRRTEAGATQRFLCRACGHRFVGADGFRNQRARPETIALSLDLYYRGMSFRAVADHLKAVHGLKVHHTTVLAWQQRFVRLASEYAQTLQVNVGGTWHMDEMKVRVKETANRVRGSKHDPQEWLYNLLDRDTRFVLATHLAKSRGLHDTRVPLQRAKQVTTGKPDVVRTDGMVVYPLALRREYPINKGKGLGRQGPHQRVPSIRAAESNNLVERLHGTLRQREKTMRGIGRHETGEGLMEGLRLYYNFIRPHLSLGGATPAEAAGIGLVTDNKWLELLRQAEEHARMKKPPG